MNCNHRTIAFSGRFHGILFPDRLINEKMERQMFKFFPYRDKTQASTFKFKKSAVQSFDYPKSSFGLQAAIPMDQSQFSIISIFS